MNKSLNAAWMAGLVLAGLALWGGTARPQTSSREAAAPANSRTAVFAGGCFWCMEGPFEALVGVSKVVSGYSGGRTANPTYKEVSNEDTGHAEVVQITYDPRKVSYQTLLEIYWRNVDPFDAGGQFCDRGASYRTEVFVTGEEERRLAEASKAAIAQRFGRTVVTPVTSAAPFYEAEEYHQDYHSRNPVRYRYYRGGCGRDARLEKIWGKEARGESIAVARIGKAHVGKE
jgi:peptide-methionine (S)-S-oxide reductase